MLFGSLFPSLKRTLYPSVFDNVQRRGRAQLAPKAVKYMKRHKGKLPIPIGGSTKGTTLAYGDYGIRIRGNGMRFSAKQLTTAQDVLKRKLREIKDAKVYLRLFPDVPVCVKGNETRMGKGKGAFEFWATRVAPGRVIFEIGTPPGTLPIREELAREALRQASDKLPCTTEFITKSAAPRLGNLEISSPSKSLDVAPVVLIIASIDALLNHTFHPGRVTTTPKNKPGIPKDNEIIRYCGEEIASQRLELSIR